MNTLKKDLLSMVENLDKELALPAISQLFIPRMTDSQHSEDKFAKFGVLILNDGSCGFFYALLGDTLGDLVRSISNDHLAGKSAISIANWYNEDSPSKRSVGMAAINAISDHVFRQSLFHEKTGHVESIKRSKPKHLGMIGFFPPLVAKFRESGQKLTVLEQNPDFLEEKSNIEVTLDPKKLFDCDEILCTASTLLNDSLQDIIDSCNKQSHISLIGPTAGCLPDALFARGISSVGASRVVNLNLLIERMKKAEPWADAVKKYTINRDDYPGYQALLK